MSLLPFFNACRLTRSEGRNDHYATRSFIYIPICRIRICCYLLTASFRCWPRAECVNILPHAGRAGRARRSWKAPLPISCRFIRAESMGGCLLPPDFAPRLEAQLAVAAATAHKSRFRLFSGVFSRQVALACVALLIVAAGVWRMRSGGFRSMGGAFEVQARALPDRTLTPGFTRDVKQADLCGRQHADPAPPAVDISSGADRVQGIRAARFREQGLRARLPDHAGAGQGKRCSEPLAGTIHVDCLECARQGRDWRIAYCTRWSVTARLTCQRRKTKLLQIGSQPTNCIFIPTARCQIRRTEPPRESAMHPPGWSPCNCPDSQSFQGLRPAANR